MTRKLNTTEKKLKFHCSVCFTLYQLLEIQQSLKTSKDTKCLNNCSQKWQSLLVTYCQEQIILDFAQKEKQKDEQSQQLAEWFKKIRNQSK